METPSMAMPVTLTSISVDAYSRSESRPARARRRLGLCLALGILLSTQLFFKIKMEAGRVLSNVHVPALCYAKPLKLLLPVKFEPGGFVRWSTTGLVITSKLD